MTHVTSSFLKDDRILPNDIGNPFLKCKQCKLFIIKFLTVLLILRNCWKQQFLTPFPLFLLGVSHYSTGERVCGQMSLGYNWVKTTRNEVSPAELLWAFNVLMFVWNLPEENVFLCWTYWSQNPSLQEHVLEITVQGTRLKWFTARSSCSLTRKNDPKSIGKIKVPEVPGKKQYA